MPRAPRHPPLRSGTMDIPVGRFMVIADPQGGVLTVMQLTETA